MPDATIFPPQRVTIVGVLNLTPDSFSDGGRFVAEARSDGGAGVPLDCEAAVGAAAALVEAGADVVDVGGESTRPGARSVPVDVEIDKHIPSRAGLGS